MDLSTLTPSELTYLLSGSTPLWPGLADLAQGGYNSHPHWACQPPPSVPTLAGFAGVRFVDGPRGVILPGGTTFPVTVARGATFDVDLEYRIGLAIGRETAKLGGNLFAGVCINLLRHPCWGRAQETYGEDSHLLGEMGVALSKGVQADGAVMACVKHFALNSMENARFHVDVRCDERALRELYLPHFERVVKEAKVACVMSAYNSVNGSFCGSSKTLLSDILRDEWKFEGFVMSDFVFGVRGSSLAALEAGLDVDMPLRLHPPPSPCRALTSPRAKFWRDLPRGAARPALVRAASRVVSTVARFSGRAAPVDAALHSALALEAARKACVLLKNEGPLLPASLGAKVLVLGALARQVNLGDRGSSNTRPTSAVATPLEGIRMQWPSARFADNPDEAAGMDLVVVVVGRTWRDEGEFVKPQIGPRLAADCLDWPRSLADVRAIASIAGMLVGGGGEFGEGGDLKNLDLSAADEALILAAARVSPNVCVVLQTGTAVTMSAWLDRVAAVVMGWYAGEQGARALGEVLSGLVCPSGKMPFCTPRRMDQLAPFVRSGSPPVTYGRFDAGQLWLDRNKTRALFPFGFGLSYTRFELGPARVLVAQQRVALAVQLRNVGARRGAEVVQVYLHVRKSKIEQPVKELKGFARVELDPGETKVVNIDVESGPAPGGGGGGGGEEEERYLLVATHAGVEPDEAEASGLLLRVPPSSKL